MALPLIAAGVMGVLGGGRYLMNKIDQRSAQESRGALEQYLQNNPQLAEQYPARVDMIRQGADSAMASGGWLQREPMSASRGMQGALQAAMQLNVNDRDQARQAQLDQASQMGTIARERQRFMEKTGLSETAGLQQSYRRDLEQFAGVQRVYQQFSNALDSNNPADVLASAFNFYNILEPGGIVRDDERGAYIGSGGKSTEIANIFNKIMGEGMTETSRQQLSDAVANQYQPYYEQAQRQFKFYDDRTQELRNRYGNVMSPKGSLGIDRQAGPRRRTFTDPNISKEEEQGLSADKPLVLRSSGNPQGMIEKMIANGLDPDIARRLR